MGSDTQRFIDQPVERWTEAPIELELDEEDAALVAMQQASSEHDLEDAGDSTDVVSTALMLYSTDVRN